MTDYYNEEENANFHTLRYFIFYFALNEYHYRAFSSVDEGEIVAARYSDENSYYRFDCCFHHKLLTYHDSKCVHSLNDENLYFRARVISFREDTYDISRFH